MAIELSTTAAMAGAGGACPAGLAGLGRGDVRLLTRDRWWARVASCPVAVRIIVGSCRGGSAHDRLHPGLRRASFRCSAVRHSEGVVKSGRHGVAFGACRSGTDRLRSRPTLW